LLNRSSSQKIETWLRILISFKRDQEWSTIPEESSQELEINQRPYKRKLRIKLKVRRTR
jgi:hypothetical protein